jgi:hypothetical protein
VNRDAAVREAEHWFLAHGLPYFVESERHAAQQGLRRGRVLSVLGAAVLTGVGAALAAGLLLSDASLGVAVGLVAAGLVGLGYALVALRLRVIAVWAVVRTLRSLGLLFPLVTRALPLLLLFVTFLFINTEVWQVATSLDGGVLWVSVLLFSGLAVAFLLVRLPEELDRVDDELDADRLVAALRGTPLADVGAELLAERPPASDHASDPGSEPGAGSGPAAPRVEDERHVAGFQRANLILVLLVSQMVQVLLLALAVLVFFLVFGVVAMRPDVIESWIGQPPQSFEVWPTLSLELAQVSVFLAAFSGLYFTVYAVTDETYREQFFTSVTAELERAVGVRAVYRSLTRR